MPEEAERSSGVSDWLAVRVLPLPASVSMNGTQPSG